MIYTILAIFCLYYLLPLYVMAVNSLKPLSEIQAGGMMSLPKQWTLAPWGSAWSTAQIGVDATGLRPFFLNSFLMVVPAVVISVLLGALNGYVLTKWRFRFDNWVFGPLLFGCFIPFQIVLIPMARLLGLMGWGEHPGPGVVHIVYGIGFSTLSFGTITNSSRPNLSARRWSMAPALHESSTGSCCRVGADRDGLGHLAVHRHLERLPLRRLVLRSKPADDRRAQQPRQVLDGMKGYNEHRRGDHRGHSHAPRPHRRG